MPVDVVRRGTPSAFHPDPDDERDAAEIIKAIDRLKKASRCVGAMALDWMIAEERAEVRSLLDPCGVDADQP